MYLLKNKIEKYETITQIQFEKVVDDLLMISINYDINDTSCLFSYWRLLGTVANPPLEVSINTDRKTIKNITFFVDADCFQKENSGDIEGTYGNILVDTTVFKTENDYIDTVGKYFISLSNNRLICTFDSNSNIKEKIGNNHVKFLINHNDKICGFEIYNLNEHQIKDIKSVQ